ncbi:6-phosphofructokinase [Thioalkalivibrio sp. XN8]|uniref:6-phosphofructokinase n=1 Tax=Thioalkalivibrio sp. XN8 TaxID=2712863 RepID=UPI0013EC816D|nr:6-phosphofructokinase [Thioalkalivibrio sp. XN8]NGP52232.1 6-phosphofructokinase [Thioalkalivibrio sp. XN8]
MKKRNLFYAQSGGVTAVINTTACGVIETARKQPARVGKIYAGRMGIVGALREELVDTGKESARDIAALRHTPGGAFGSVRYKLKSIRESAAEYQRLIEVFRAHDIGYFIYNGGGDSMDTANKVAQVAKSMDYDITCVGVPKTVDNDLPITDNCPGFGSVAKYVAVSTLEAGIDIASMPATKVFILEVMGRHAGWIAAAGGLAGKDRSEPPHLILFPEVPFDEDRFVAKVKESVERHDSCVIVASEGIRRPDGRFVAESGTTDAFGHAQLGGVAPHLAEIVRGRLGYKFHWGVADYLQRSARHIASKVDVEQAYAMGKAAVEMALAGVHGKLPVIVRTSDQPYRWKVGQADLAKVANVEKTVPKKYIAADGFHITAACRRYLAPLIRGEDYPPYKDGLPQYVKLKNQLAPKKLPAWKG